MDKSQILSDRSLRFIQTIFRTYLEERDFTKFISALDDDISWFGTGVQEVCKNYSEAVALIKAEKESWDGYFTILEQWYQAYPLTENFCMVYGEMKIVENGSNPILMEMCSRFSAICHCINKDEIKLLHVHFSVPSAVQSEDEFVHKSAVKDYNRMLEEKLEERTELLKQKSFEWETITNNIEAGIVRCDLEDSLMISYANDGFYRMIGYTRKQFQEELDNCIKRLIHPDDGLAAYKKAKGQMKIGNSIVTVSRIVRRNKTAVWILIKGTIVIGLNGKQELHAVLTDITEQQEQEEALRISEKRYEIAMQLCDATIFEYNVITKQLMLPSLVADLYDVPKIVENGVEAFIKQGIIEPESADAYRELYQKIHNGAPSAKTFIKAKDDSGIIHEYELNLTNVFDKNGKPIRAIGVRRNVTVMRQLEKEKNYGETLASDKHFVCEANITQDKIISINKSWVEDFDGTGITSYSELMDTACKAIVEPSYRDIVNRYLSRENLESAFEKGQKLISFIYRKKSKKADYRWFEATLNIIRDSTTQEINVRYYTTDINIQKEKEQKALDEQRLYENMVARSIIAYEVNITKDQFISGNQNWGKQFGIEQSNCYSHLMRDLGEKAIHPNERTCFLKMYSHENVVKAFREGKREIVCEYRRPDETGEFIWVKCSLHIYEDLSTGDVKGYAYVENINKQKQEQLELIYRSEHDLLTGLYNKTTTEKLIDDFLNTAKGKTAKHAYIIIDIDHFKEINDNFGHAFGDAVLSQISSKIRELFREDDVVGRIGGDEFVVLMKNISNSKIAIAKAGEICGVLAETYTQGGQEYKISASVGIAIYNKHGKNYDELYRHSDSALYVSKRNGRDRFYLYTDNMEMVVSEVKDIDPNLLLEVKTFEQNILEYVFRILYESQDIDSAVNSVLSLIGKHYNVSRAYIFEDSADGCHTSNIFEWCNTGVKPRKEEMQNIAYINPDKYRDSFKNEGIYYGADMEKLPDDEREAFQGNDIKSMIQYAMIKKGNFAGFIGFDECRYLRMPSKRELTELNNISNLLGMFIVEMGALKQNEAMKNTAMSILEGFDSCAYLCDSKKYEILFINTHTEKVAPMVHVGDTCYKAFCNLEAPCKDCPMEALEENGKTKVSVHLYNDKHKVLVKTTASWIGWMGDEKVCLLTFQN